MIPQFYGFNVKIAKTNCESGVKLLWCLEHMTVRFPRPRGSVLRWSLGLRKWETEVGSDAFVGLSFPLRTFTCGKALLGSERVSYQQTTMISKSWRARMQLSFKKLTGAAGQFCPGLAFLFLPNSGFGWLRSDSFNESCDRKPMSKKWKTPQRDRRWDDELRYEVMWISRHSQTLTFHFQNNPGSPKH